MTYAPIVLVPGFWLGAWAWDEVAAALRADGHDVTALTLPGLESADADRSSITLSDHVDAICEAVRAAGAPVVLAVHSGAGFSGYGASDRIPERIAAMVYVDSAPGRPLGSRLRCRREAPALVEEFVEEENLNGLSGSSSRSSGVAPCRSRAASCARWSELTNDARLDIPCTVVCTGFSSEHLRPPSRSTARRGSRVSPIPRRHLGRSADEPLVIWSRPQELRPDCRRRREDSRPPRQPLG